MEEFFEAAVRHWYDGKILEENAEYDNAVCMQGFAAECALKKIIQTAYSIEVIKKYGHSGKEMLQDMCLMLLNDNPLFSMLDPTLGLRMSELNISDILFQDHPARRYYKDNIYTAEDARLCRMDAEKVIHEMLRLYVDGYIK